MFAAWGSGDQKGGTAPLAAWSKINAARLTGFKNKSNTMNSKIRIALAGLACVAACAIGFGQTPGIDSQIPGAAPAQGYVWMSGHWDSDGSQWKWVAAHWDLPPSPSATWVGGHWVS